MRRHLVIGDLQVKPGIKLDHISHIGRFAAEKRPDVIVQIGDWNDNQSLSSWDRGKAAAENRRVTRDYAYFVRSVDLFMTEIERVKGYRPRLVFTDGNHDGGREDRYENENPELLGVLPKSRDYLASVGWETHRFMRPVVIDGVSYCHLHPRTLSGKVTASSMKFGAPNAAVMIRANMRSCTAGHSPGVQYAVHPGDKGLYHGLILGSSYTHNETYLPLSGNAYWRGVVMKNRVRNGTYDPCFVSLDYLKARFAKKGRK